MSSPLPRLDPSPLELSEKDLAILLSHGRTRLHAKGDVIYYEGDLPDSLYLVKSGRVNITKASSSGSESLIAFYGPGETFCTASLILAKPFPCMARAATDSTVIYLPASSFRVLFDQMPSFARRLVVEMAPQLCGSHCQCAAGMEKVDKRLALVLLRLDQQFCGETLPFTRQELAEMANTTVETCIRTLSTWKDEGWIAGSRGELRLIDRIALRVLVDDLQ
jgi:CRP/FNR family transcriptional regulator, cyclic AMP receptor protein